MADLLKEVIDAHGGSKRWGEVREIRAHVRSGGLLMRSKLKASRFRDYGLSVATGHQSAILEPFPGPGETGVFEEGAVRIVKSQGGLAAKREDARAAFFGIRGARRKLWWSDLDALYFAGYAMWNYLNTPFVLASEGFQATEGEPLAVDGEEWRRLDVTFPEGFHTHSREQSFYWGPDGMLRRHDYSPDVVSTHANAVHLSTDHREFDGIVFPTRRAVVPRGPGGRPLPGPTLVSIRLDSIALS